jgi:hypothetical protein
MKKKNVGLTRKKADQILSRLTGTADECYFENKCEVPYYASRIIVFGSYLTDKEKLGDLDVFIEKKCKWKYRGEMVDFFLNHPNNNERTIINKLAFPDNVFYRFLKQGSTSLSMHDISEMDAFLQKNPEFKYEEIYNVKSLTEEEGALIPEWLKEQQLETLEMVKMQQA